MGLILKDLFLVILLTVLISGAAVVLLVWLPKSVHARYTLARPLPLLVLLICTVACLYESFCFVGALRVNRYIGAVAQKIESVSPPPPSGKLAESDIVRRIEKEYPFLARFVSADDADAVVSCAVYFQELRSSVRGYAWRRALWLLGFLVVGGGLLIRDSSQQCKRDRAFQNRFLDLE